MNRKPAMPSYETRISNVQRKQVGASEFRIHTWFDHQRNTFVVDVLTADEPLPQNQQRKAAATGGNR